MVRIYVHTLYVALFYYTLGNIAPQHRANLKVIQLLAVVKTDYVTKYGIDQILEPFITGVQELEKVGIPLECYYANTIIHHYMYIGTYDTLVHLIFIGLGNEHKRKN